MARVTMRGWRFGARSGAPAVPEICSTRVTTCAKSTHVFQQVTTDRAFLPEMDPLMRLPSSLQAYDDALAELPKLAVGSPGMLRHALQALPVFDLQQLPAMAAISQQQPQHYQLPPAGSCYTSSSSSGSSSNSNERGSETQQLLDQASSDAQLWRAYMVLSFLSHAFLWCDTNRDVPRVLPAGLAQPWAHVSAAIQMPPVLVYATYNLMNWRRLDPTGPVELGNIACQHNFLGGIDEEWFRLVHVAIEAAAAPAIAALQPLQQAARQHDREGLEKHLAIIITCLKDMQQLLARMCEHCDPYIYYQRVRVPMSGWRSNPALPEGLVYEGLWGDKPQQLYGETGAQSAIVPALDIVLGIQHESGWLQHYLLDMQVHMPPAHRAFLQQLEADGPLVRQAVQQLTATAASATTSHASTALPAPDTSSTKKRMSSSAKSLLQMYDAAVLELERFRGQHRAFAKQYIAQWSNKVETGTGGSNFMPALTAYRNSTAAHKLSNNVDG